MSQKPNDQLLESLSALADDEASELEVRRILKNVDRNPEMLACWQRYNLIGSLMRKETLGDQFEFGESGFAASVAAAIRDEPEMTGKTSPGSQTYFKRTDFDGHRPKAQSPYWAWFGKASIAASFAAAIVFGANFLSAPGDVSADKGSQMADAPAEDATPNVGLPQGFQIPALEARTVSQSNHQPRVFDSTSRSTSTLPVANDLTDGATQDMLNEMLIFHAERASVNGGLGMMPFARVSKMNSAR